MHRISLLLLASSALFSISCERHSVAALEEKNGAGPHTAATQNRSSDTEHRDMSTPHAPQNIPTNPAGSAPVSNQAARESTGQPQPQAVPQSAPSHK